MRLPSLSRTGLVLAVATALVVSGCASGRDFGAGREGLPETLNGLDYNVLISRILNPKDHEDSAYYAGPEAPPGYVLYGVFLSVCNDHRGGRAFPATGHFRIVNTVGQSFFPIRLPASNPWAYQPAVVNHRECIPYAGSVADTGPTTGALLLFQLPQAATEDRPLDMIIGRGKQNLRIELDI
jgi:hypothetical protein